MKKKHSLAYAIVRTRMRNKPYKLNYAVTYSCNARCKVCSIWKKYLLSPEKAKEELNLAEIDSIFRNFDLSWLSLTGGEPFLRKDLSKIVELAEAHNPHLNLLTIPTNGSLPDRVVKTVESILEETKISNIVATVSLDGDEPLHDYLRGVKGLWKKALETYSSLHSLENDRFTVLVEFAVSQHNAGYLKNALDSFNVKDYTRVVLTAAHPSYFYGTENSKLHTESSAAQVDEFLSSNSMKMDNFLSYIYTRLLKKYLLRGPIPLSCVSGRSSFFLDPYGFLYPCISMDRPLGNLRKFSLSQLLQSKEAASIVEQIRRRECPRCWTPCEAYQTILENFPTALTHAFLK